MNIRSVPLNLHWLHHHHSSKRALGSSGRWPHRPTLTYQKWNKKLTCKHMMGMVVIFSEDYDCDIHPTCAHCRQGEKCPHTRIFVTSFNCLSCLLIFVISFNICHLFNYEMYVYRWAPSFDCLQSGAAVSFLAFGKSFFSSGIWCVFWHLANMCFSGFW